MVAADFCDAMMAPPVKTVIRVAATASRSAVRRLMENPPGEVTGNESTTLFEGDAQPEVEARVAAARSGDVERQADDGQVQVDAAADAAIDEVLVREFVADAVDRARVDERLDAKSADR